MATVDTLKAYETLTGADMPERQACALVTIVQELQETRFGRCGWQRRYRLSQDLSQ
jgi:hypothetical protein